MVQLSQASCLGWPGQSVTPKLYSLAVDILPVRSLLDPHLLTDILCLVHALWLHLHLRYGNGVGFTSLLEEELANNLEVKVLD